MLTWGGTETRVRRDASHSAQTPFVSGRPVRPHSTQNSPAADRSFAGASGVEADDLGMGYTPEHPSVVLGEQALLLGDLTDPGTQ